ncbi:MULTISPECIES: maleylpyruvate isomerase family mycothiol-dependent enzyme [Pseudonocardia]|uniref:Mycothiol-dependent maleylpyruvate isomerase n=2 Tax=Pseudonocardia TaxID=1847 RepID=A0A1Y2MKY8_PSEAH|nr:MULTISPECIES: maleylpyruvate isomerase family mycothiol-dependent enzyme [Pseudonocardia]OSY35822.1 mycothiol-dependent maleylpyruvate isomerase [Pseudonocardia autotrophica]TDN73116.1 maleylpyruvate isomerase [Pseudonocardia autotrophica]BBG03835.1 maleylpyruvate isomerase [Pseudonocardia autotrophica]GEC27366.1 maleylpyruvate isomerase [Pseudonocardia saturnea]
MSARTDLATDPALREMLLQARRGQAYFSRQLEELRDTELAGPSRLPGWSRAHVAAHVGLNARALTRLCSWARTGVPNPMYASPQQRGSEIDLGATLPVRAIRHLSDHAAVHLDVEWRDLEPEQWTNEVVTAQGRTVPVGETVWMRIREVWLHAVDLGNGGRVADFPAMVVDGLLDDLIAVWRRKRVPGSPGLVLDPTDRDRVLALDPGSAGPDDTTVRGTAVDLVAWGTGRTGAGAVRTAAGSPPPPAPQWL